MNNSLFAPIQQNQLVLEVEAAFSRAQAKHGIIPQWAAREITAKAQIRFTPEEDLAQEFSLVQHRMVALLNVWSKSMENGAEEYMHFGTTTVDIYDTVKVLQLRQSTLFGLASLRTLEATLIELAQKHRDTPMIGRTLGQHALPITFGKKVSCWLGSNRRNIERLKAVLEKLEHSAILKGAVGSYLGLGEKGIELEKDFARELGLKEPYQDDWHGSRDVFAEYAMVMSLISRALGQIGNEIFLLQTTDIAEVIETKKKSAIGSSSMPHKNNPQKSDSLIFLSRKIPRLAEIVLDDMVNYFERDDTSRTNELLEEMDLQTRKMFSEAQELLENLKINNKKMIENLQKTKGLILSQRITLALAERIGNRTAKEAMHLVVNEAHNKNCTLRETLEEHPELIKHLTDKEIDDLFNLKTYTGLAAQQVDGVIDYVSQKRLSDPVL
ncbi:lyase family protein [Dethiosulfatarculus sandiegensis]|nr:lyase family protein [Dethiosulfatarculus sandiegensis]